MSPASPGSCCGSQLLFFDLAYFKLQRFMRIHRNGGFVLTRLEEGCGRRARLAGAPVVASVPETLSAC